MKTTLIVVCVLISLSAFSQSSVLIEPKNNNGIFSKNNTTVFSNPGTVQLPASGAGTRLMWIPAKSAFRVGTVYDTSWDADSIGVFSMAFGSGTRAKGESSTAFGIGAKASADFSTAFGFNTLASGYEATAFGDNTISNGYASTTFGVSTAANGNSSTAWGYGTVAQGDNTTALGEFTTAQAYDSFMMGRYNVIAGTTDTWVTTDPLFVIGNGTAANARSNAVTVLKNGRVGIGTPSPDAPLHITGAGTSIKFQAAYFDASSGTSIVNNTVTPNIKVHADGWFWADGGGFVATSDARIKHIIGQSNSAQDLDKLSRIAVTDYTYIDQVNHGNTPQKKVIAQQLKQLLPEAVSQNKGFIPNVYQTAQQVSIVGNTTHIVTSKAHDFVTGDVVKVMVENESEKILEVTVVNAHTFSVAEVLKGRIFVYGKQVEDLHHVDYDAIAMLNVSATQELAKQLEMLKDENESLKKIVNEMAKKNESLEIKVSDIEVLKSKMSSLSNLLLKTNNQSQTRNVAENKK